MYGGGDGEFRLGGGGEGVGVETPTVSLEEDSVTECSEMLHNIVLQVEVTDS